MPSPHPITLHFYPHLKIQAYTPFRGTPSIIGVGPPFQLIEPSARLTKIAGGDTQRGDNTRFIEQPSLPQQPNSSKLSSTPYLESSLTLFETRKHFSRTLLTDKEKEGLQVLIQEHERSEGLSLVVPFFTTECAS